MKVGEKSTPCGPLAMIHFYLVVPRILACIVMTTCLSAIGDASGVGGVGVGTFMMDIDPPRIWRSWLGPPNCLTWFPVWRKPSVWRDRGRVACFGLAVQGADAVGRAATDIVWSIVTLILADLLFTIGFYAIGVG